MRKTSGWILLGLLAAWAPALPAPAAFAQEGVGRRALIEGSLVGRENFEAYCASCHGRSGRGNGPVAAELVTPPANLTTLSRRNGGVFPREQLNAYVDGTGRAISAHGPTSMPVCGPIFRIFDPDARARTRIANLVTYIESLQRRE